MILEQMAKTIIFPMLVWFRPNEQNGLGRVCPEMEKQIFVVAWSNTALAGRSPESQGQLVWPALGELALPQPSLVMQQGTKEAVV